MKAKKINIPSLCDELKSRDEFILLAHASPDGDTVGACYALGYALKQMGKKVKIRCSDSIPTKYGYITAGFRANQVENPAIVALDVADDKLLGSLREEYLNRIDICIDHHVSNIGYAESLLLDAEASATCEIVFEILKELKIKWSRHIIDAIYTGIVTDTGCFKYSNTTSRTHRMSAELIELGVDYSEINRLMFDTKSKARIKIEAAVMQNMEYYFGGRVAVVTLTGQMLERCGTREDELDGVNALSRTVEGVMVGITLRQKGEVYKISLRTNAPIDASLICRNFGGGGHSRAAGCEFNCEPEEIKAKLLPVVKQTLEEQGCLI